MPLAKLVLLSLLAASPLALADTFPNGGYLFNAHPGTGIHLSTGALSGYINFDVSHNVTAADVVYTDANTHISYLFSQVGPTTYDSHDHLLSATITDLANPAYFYQFSILTGVLPDGSFQLSCGVDCDTYVSLPGAFNNYEEFAGTIYPTPEPSSLVLLGSGALVLAGAFRRRVLRA